MGEMGKDTAQHAPLIGLEYPAMLPVEALEKEFVLAPGELGAMALRVDRRDISIFDGEQSRQGILIGEIGLMIHFDDSSELTDIPQIYHLPNTPHWLLGVVNLHGRLIPVFDLLRFLHLDRAAAAQMLGAKGYITKPYNDADVLNVVRGL